MDRVDQVADDFNRNVPFSDDAFMVLRMHLLMERELRAYIKWRVENDVFFEELNNHHAISGGTLILLAQALSLRDEHAPVAPIAFRNFWAALKMLNKMRNILMHQVSPDDSVIEKQMKTFIHDATSMLGSPFSENDNLRQQFYKSAKYLLAMLANDRYPITSDGRFSKLIHEGRGEEE